MATGLIVSIIGMAGTVAGVAGLLGAKRVASAAAAVVLVGLLYGAYGRREVLDEWTAQQIDKAQAETRPVVDAIVRAFMPTTTTTIPK